MKKITIFTIPKAFVGESAILQRNAITSWMDLDPQPEVILFGNDEGTAEFATELGFKHVPDVACSKYGTPLIDDMFNKAQEIASGDIVVYINADIIIVDGFLSTIERVDTVFEKYLLVGQRHDLKVNDLIDFNNAEWKGHLRSSVDCDGSIHPPCGVDYFIFTKDMWGEIPPFAIGRSAWDNWFVARALELKIPVVDCTDEILIVHQDHDYNHVKGGKQSAFKGEEARKNQALAGGVEACRYIQDSDWVFNHSGFLLYRALCERLPVDELYAAWSEFRDEGNSIGSVLLKLNVKKVAVFGTSKAALLLKDDFSSIDISTVAFIDSNLKEKAKIDEIDVVAPEWLSTNAESVSAVIVSVEGSHSVDIKDMIRKKIKNAEVHIYSWKELVVMAKNNRMLAC